MTQPSEPILIPKLRIYFADFPYLRYSIGQRLFTLETCCGYGYEFARNLHASLPTNHFKGQRKRIGWHKTCATFSGRSPYLRANRFQGIHFTRFEPLNKKRQLSPKLALT